MWFRSGIHSYDGEMMKEIALTSFALYDANSSFAHSLCPTHVNWRHKKM